MVSEIRLRDDCPGAPKPREAGLGAPKPREGGSTLRRLVLCLLALGALLFALYHFRSPLCQWAATAWIVNDPLDHADAIVILGGGLDTRPIEAARLYHLGLAPKILVMKDKPRPVASLGLPTEVELTRQVLLKKDVPESAIVVIGNPDTGVANTYDESIALRDWLSQEKAESRKQKTEIVPSPGGEGKGEGELSPTPVASGPGPVVSSPVVSGPVVSGPLVSSPSSVIIVTDLFHSRRARWLFRKQLKSLDARIAVDAAPMLEYSASDWWRHENGVVAFQNEILKDLYYHLRY